MTPKNDCKEIVADLQEKVDGYERIMDKILAQPRKVARIQAGPLDGEVPLYRVLEGSTAHILPMLDPQEKKPILNQEVVINETGIVCIVQDELAVATPLPEFQPIDWTEIGGLKSQLERIKDAVEAPIMHAKMYEAYGISPTKGMLLYGPPGNGKTLIARAIATTIVKYGGKSAVGTSFHYVKGPELLSRWVGAAEEAIRHLFGEARLYTKKTGNRSVIFIDEADAILMRRGSGISSDMSSTIVPQFLSEMDGFDEHSPFVLLSTNLPEAIDPAILREGRIDVKIHVSRPSKEDGKDIFMVHLDKVKCKVKTEALADEGCELLYASPVVKQVSGAMIATLVNDAARVALKRDLKDGTKTGITTPDLKQAIETISLS